MRHHSIVCRLGASDAGPVRALRPGSHATEIGFIDGQRRLGFGLGQVLDQLGALGLRPAERAVDLALVAAAVTAADTRVSRNTEAQDGWTREIDLHLPVAEPGAWEVVAPLLARTLGFLTGDRWGLHFRHRPAGVGRLAAPPGRLRTADPSGVCLFSGGLDSFVGAIDLAAAGEAPLLVSHYWDGITSRHQTHCSRCLRSGFRPAGLHHVRARVGFPSGTVAGSKAENTLRGRSFLFFALASLAAAALGRREVAVHVPENGFISLNVPLDPLRLGALSTRTTHPFYMARWNELLRALDLPARLDNRYRHRTKGEMIRGCADRAFLRRHAKDTMSCSSPTKARWAGSPPMHCGHCVPCLIRRAAMLAGFGSDDTSYTIPDLRARPLDANKAEGANVRSFQLALARFEANPLLARLLVHQPGPLADDPGDVAGYEAVYAAGLREVGDLLGGVAARPL